MPVRIERTPFQGWPNCYRISNGEADVLVTGDVGPRILRYGFTGGRNLFKEFPDQFGRSGEPAWRPRGGHRLWVAPEVAPDKSSITYAADNGAVEIEVRGDSLLATATVERVSGLQKQIGVRLAGSGTRVEVIHRIANRNPWTIELAAWGLTMMAPGGTGFFGLPPRGTHPEILAPSNPLVIWAFTDLSDPRWTFTKKYVALRQDPANPVPQKIGSFHADTWGAYLLEGDLFLKRSAADAAQRYPDLGASFEIFTNHETLELETLGPLTRLEPDGALEHLEVWSLHRAGEVEISDAGLDRLMPPLLNGQA